MAKRKIGVIDTNTINAMNLYAKEVVKRAKRNLKIKKKIEGKYRVTDNTGDLAKGLSYKLVKSNNKLNMRFTSNQPYADFIEQGVKGSPKRKGESEESKDRRASFKARFRKDIKRGKMSAAYWANRVKW